MKKVVLASIVSLFFITPASAQEFIETDWSLEASAVQEVIPVAVQQEETVDFSKPEGYKTFKQKQKEENWNKVKPFEMIWQGAHGIDAIQTGQCSRSVYCHETNNLLGRKPSDKKIAVWWAATSAIHYILAKEAAERSPTAGYVFVGISTAMKLNTIRKNANIVGINIPW